MVEALGAGAIVAVPNVGGYSLAVRAGSLDDEAKLVELAADPDGPHYAVGQIEDVRALTSGWTDELGTLLERCWPGPVEVFLPRAGGPGWTDGAESGVAVGPDDGAAENGAWAAVVGMPDGRALRRLCREQGPWRTVPLRFTEAEEVAQAFGAARRGAGDRRWPARRPPPDGGGRDGHADPRPARGRAAVLLH